MATVISILIAAVGADTSSREEQIYPCTTSDVEDDGVRLDLTDCVWISDAGKSRRDACGEELCKLVLVVSEPGSCVLGSAVEMKVAGRRHGHARIHRSNLVPESRHVEVNRARQRHRLPSAAITLSGPRKHRIYSRPLAFKILFLRWILA